MFSRYLRAVECTHGKMLSQDNVLYLKSTPVTRNQTQRAMQKMKNCLEKEKKRNLFVSYRIQGSKDGLCG